MSPSNCTRRGGTADHSSQHMFGKMGGWRGRGVATNMMGEKDYRTSRVDECGGGDEVEIRYGGKWKYNYMRQRRPRRTKRRRKWKHLTPALDVLSREKSTYMVPVAAHQPPAWSGEASLQRRDTVSRLRRHLHAGMPKMGW